jgi:hypothetical protein
VEKRDNLSPVYLNTVNIMAKRPNFVIVPKTPTNGQYKTNNKCTYNVHTLYRLERERGEMDGWMDRDKRQLKREAGCNK